MIHIVHPYCILWNMEGYAFHTLDDIQAWLDSCKDFQAISLNHECRSLHALRRGYADHDFNNFDLLLLFKDRHDAIYFKLTWMTYGKETHS